MDYSRIDTVQMNFCQTLVFNAIVGETLSNI